MDVYFIVNGNIYNQPLPKQQYTWGCGWFGLGCTSANAIIPEPPSTYVAESYKNAYETAFKAEQNRELNLYPVRISLNNLPKEFINGTFGYKEIYSGIQQPVSYLVSNSVNYQGQPYLFISTGSGGGSGFIYLNWIVATFGIPYMMSIPKK